MTITQQSLLKTGLISGAIVISLALSGCGDDSGGDSSPVKKEQSITFNAPMTLGVGESAELTATASSDLEVTYAATTPEVCTVSEKTVLAKAIGDCSLTASQAGNTDFNPADNVSVSFAVIPATVAISDVSTIKAGEESKISLSGKQVTQNLTATLAGETIPVSSMGDYSAQISVTPTMAGDVPLLVKDGDTVLIDELLQVALPEATGDSFTVKKTGVTKCANFTENNIDCSDQDKLGEFYQTNQDGEVQAGVDPAYIKVAHQVEKDDEKSMEYCVYDKVAGLMWEQKTDDEGLRDKDWRYTWYDSNPATNGGVAGVDAPEEDTCNGSLAKCNTENYIKQLNATNYCGHNDWRLPTDLELLSLRDFGKTEAPFADPIFNLVKRVKQDHSDYKTSGTYTTQTSEYASQDYKDAGSQSAVGLDFSNYGLFYRAGFKNGFPHYILATRSTK